MPVTDPGSLPRAWSVIAGRDNKGPWGALEFKLRQNAMQLVCAPLEHRRWGLGVWCCVCPWPRPECIVPVSCAPAPSPLRCPQGSLGRTWQDARESGCLGVWV